MKNILKRVIFPLMLTPTIVAPLAVTACAFNIETATLFSPYVDVTDLGFVEDLSSETIAKVFFEKNPRVVKDTNATFYAMSGLSDSHKGMIMLSTPISYDDGLNHPAVWVTYSSKLEYSEDNKEQYEISEKNNQITINFNILDDSYDETVDKKISCFFWESNDGYDTPPYEWKTFEHRIDKTTGKYQIIISLNNLRELLPWYLNWARIVFRWGDKNWTSQLGVHLGIIDITIKN